MTSHGFSPGLHMMKFDQKSRLDGLFTLEGLTVMLEAADMTIIDIVSPFLGVLIFRVSAKTESCTITIMFTDYVYIMYDVCGITKRGKWKDQELVMLEEQIKSFKVMERLFLATCNDPICVR